LGLARTMVAVGVVRLEKSADCSSASRRSSNEPTREISPPLLLPDHIAHSRTLELSTGKMLDIILLQLCLSPPANAAQTIRRLFEAKRNLSTIDQPLINRSRAQSP
jgi:hypothetical protein